MRRGGCQRYALDRRWPAFSRMPARTSSALADSGLAAAARTYSLILLISSLTLLLDILENPVFTSERVAEMRGKINPLGEGSLAKVSADMRSTKERRDRAKDPTAHLPIKPVATMRDNAGGGRITCD